MPQIVVLVSGGGTNLQAIIDAIDNQSLDCQISAVIADRDCHGLVRAAKSNIPAHLVDRKIHRENLSAAINRLIPANCDLIVLGGFLSILDNGFIEQWQNKIINIHPSLLPKYGGAGMWGNKVHAAVLANLETESGCTVHLVTNQIDCGEIITQSKVPVYVDDTVESLRLRVQEAEHKALIKAIKVVSNSSKIKK